MTLVLSVNGPETLWLLADRRLSDARGRIVRDDATKLMTLETPDAVALLGYAGLGATASGTQPSDWMSAVLRGRNNQLEPTLGVLSEAAQREIPRHLAGAPTTTAAAHTILITSFLDDRPMVYTIDLALSPDRKQYTFGYNRRFAGPGEPFASRPPRVALAGSGATMLERDRGWMRPLLNSVRAHDEGRVSADVVADHLAMINLRVHRTLKDGTVGPRCLVMWRYRKSGERGGGGGHNAYTDATRDSLSPLLPEIAHGMDTSALINALVPDLSEALEKGFPGIDGAALRRIAQLPDGPDERLR